MPLVFASVWLISIRRTGNFSFAFPLAAWAFLGYSSPFYLFGSNDGASFTLISTTAVAGAPICASPPSAMPCSYLVNALPPASQPSFSIYRVVSPANNYDYAATLFTPASPTTKSLALASLALTSSDGVAGAGAALSHAQPAPSPAAVAARDAWISAASAGGAAACVAASLLLRVSRRRRAAYAAKTAAAEKIPVTHVSVAQC